MSEWLRDPYPSRVDTNPAILRRVDPVVYSDGPPPPPLTTQQVESYRRDGLLFIEELFDPAEVSTLVEGLHALLRDKDIRAARESILEPDSGDVRSVFRVHQLSDLFRSLARHPRILDIVHYILDDEVYVHQSRVNFKRGFVGKEFYWHSDFETWHVEDGMPRMRALSASVTLTENSEFNGPLMAIPGSHTSLVACVGETPEDHYRDSLRKQEYGVPDPVTLKMLADRGGIVAPKGPPGSVLLFDCNLMHGSNSNISPYPRSNAFMVYNSVRNVLAEPFGGLSPRPEFVATRTHVEPLRTATDDVLRSSSGGGSVQPSAIAEPA